MNRVILSLAVLTLALMFTQHCTGRNDGMTFGLPNTNPTPEYANSAAYFSRGGALYHSNSAPGPIGNANSTKTGEACSHAVLGLVSVGDSSIATAKSNGGISKIAFVEYEQLGALAIVYHRFCTKVAGE